jgi:glc operon protein GlcG
VQTYRYAEETEGFDGTGRAAAVGCGLSMLHRSTITERERRRAPRSVSLGMFETAKGGLTVNKTFIISGAVTGLMLWLPMQSHAQQQGRSAPAKQMTRDIKIISTAGARALADACTTWAEQNKQVVAMAILDWGGNLVESHAMEGAAMNAIDTALLKAKSALRWRRPTSETNKMVRTGQNLAPTFMRDFPQPGALPIVVNGEVIGAMGVSGADGEKCAQAAIDAVFKGQTTSSSVR